MGPQVRLPNNARVCVAYDSSHHVVPDTGTLRLSSSCSLSYLTLCPFRFNHGWSVVDVITRYPLDTLMPLYLALD